MIDGEKIRFDQVAVTMKMCAPEYMALESEMLNLLNNARSAKQTKDALTFFDADGKAIIDVTDLDDARDYLCENFGIARSSLRSNVSVPRAAEEHNIVFRGIE